MRNIAYFTEWSARERGVSVSDIDPLLVTHINFAFAALDGNGKIYLNDEYTDTQKHFNKLNDENNKGVFGQLRMLKKQYPHIKTLISIGGWAGSKNFCAVAADIEKRRCFAKSVLDFILRHGFDGADIDWEFPVAGGDDIPHSADDGRNYLLLLRELRAAFDAQAEKDGRVYLITIAAAGFRAFAENTDIALLSQPLDFINLMTYDITGSWDSITGFNAPLRQSPYDTTPNAQAAVENTVNAYLKCGVNPKKLNLGLGFYARCWHNVNGENNGLYQSGTAPDKTGYLNGTWEGAVMDIWDINQNYIGKSGFKEYYDEYAEAPYLFNGSVFISYENRRSITAKTEFAVKNGLGGVMFWEFCGDREKQLQQSAARVLGIYKK